MYATGVRRRIPNSRDCKRKPVNKFPQFVVCHTLKSKDCTLIMFSGCKNCNQTITFTGKSFVSAAKNISKSVDQPDFLRIVLLTDEADFTRNGVFKS
jgi:hypothetical protein